MSTTIQKELGAMEDLATGVGSVTQSRNGQDVEVNKVDAAFAVNSIAEMQAVDPARFTNCRVYSGESKYTDYRYSSTSTNGLPSLGMGTWVRSDLTEVADIFSLVNAKVDWSDYVGRKVVVSDRKKPYRIWTLADYRSEIGDPSWTPISSGAPNYFGADHYVGGTTYVAILDNDGFSISIEDCGASTDFADNNQPITLCAEYCNGGTGGAAYKPPILMGIPDGLFVSSPLDFNGLTRMRGIIGTGIGSVIRCATGTYAANTAVIDWQDITGRVLKDFRVQCEDQTDRGINTDWNGGAGPSLQNEYENVWIEGYKHTAWKALDNNDSPFNKIHIRQPGASSIANPIAVDIFAGGGLISFTDCFMPGGAIKYNAQNCIVTGGFYFAFIAQGGSYNVLSVNGAYPYSGFNGAMVDTDGSSSIRAFSFKECLIVMSGEGGKIIQGKYDLGGEFANSRVDLSQTSYVGDGEAFGALTRQTTNRSPVINFERCTLDDVAFNENAANNSVEFTYKNVYTSISSPSAWAASTVYAVDDTVTNGNRVYVCTVAGTSATSIGPTTAGTGIVDGTAQWDYFHPAQSALGHGIHWHGFKNNQVNNVTGNGAVYVYGWNQEISASHSASRLFAGGGFRCRIPGLYTVSAGVLLRNVTASHTSITLRARSSKNGGTFINLWKGHGGLRDSANEIAAAGSAQIRLDYDETLRIELVATGSGSNDLDVGGSTKETDYFFIDGVDV